MVVERLVMGAVALFISPLEHQLIVDEHHRYVEKLSNQTKNCFFEQSFHQIEMHRDYTSNVVANRFKPLIAYTSPNSNTYDRSSAIVNLPPTPSPTSLNLRHGNLIRKEQPDVDHLTKLLMKSMNSSNEPNFFG
jgi:hypothetical protein